jgi:hypothetical protein
MYERWYSILRKMTQLFCWYFIIRLHSFRYSYKLNLAFKLNTTAISLCLLLAVIIINIKYASPKRHSGLGKDINQQAISTTIRRNKQI